MAGASVLVYLLSGVNRSISSTTLAMSCLSLFFRTSHQLSTLGQDIPRMPKQSDKRLLQRGHTRQKILRCFGARSSTDQQSVSRNASHQEGLRSKESLHSIRGNLEKAPPLPVRPRPPQPFKDSSRQTCVFYMDPDEVPPPVRYDRKPSISAKVSWKITTSQNHEGKQLFNRIRVEKYRIQFVNGKLNRL